MFLVNSDETLPCPLFQAFCPVLRNATAITGEGKTLWDTFKKEIDDHLKPDLILIDSRTGINKWGALSLLEAAKEIIIFLYPNEQNFLGVQTLFQSLQCLNKIDINFVFSPVPDSEESGKDRVNKIIEKIKQSFQNEEEENQEESNEFSRFAFFTVPYLQPIALSDKYPSVGLVDYYQPIANLIDEEVSESLNDRSQSYNSETRWQIIEDLRFPSLNAAAADQELKHLFQKTANFEKFLDETTCLIKGRKGTGKTALYFLLLKHTETAKKLARHRLDNVTLCSGHGSFRESRLTRDDFLHIDKYLTANQSTWEVFWRSYLLFSLYTDKKFDFPRRGKSREKVSEIIDILRSHRDQKHWQSEKTEALIRLSTSISSGKNLSLLVSDALNLYNEDSKKKQTITWLLYDELDEDFPASIRKQALTGLFQLIQSCDARGFKNIRFKVFLREDIWNDLNFENKSHFNGRDLILEWTRSDFLKLALRLATRSTLFKELLDKNHPIADIDEASEAKVSEALDILWGTRRRKGDKAKYVTRWVYERLTDSSGRTFPRSLTALLDGAKTHELTHKDNPSIQHPSDRLLRSQSLEEGLRKASIERCEAIKQEYENLVSFFDSLDGINAFLSTEELQTIWNQHLNSHDIRSFEDFTNFLENIGVIQWRGKENRYRFVDLYIYGFKLNYQGAK